jgi:hypothetical protein
MAAAAYNLLFTGNGRAFPAAAALRWTLIALSVAALAYLVLRAARRALSPPHDPGRSRMKYAQLPRRTERGGS